MEELNTNPAQEKPVMGNEKIEAYLKETAQWGKFLAIMGYVLMGILVLVALAMMVGMSAFSKATGHGIFSVLLGMIYILLAGVYFVPITYLYRFSTQVKQAVENNNEEEYTTAFQNLKSLFKFLGIFTIVMLALYAVALVVALPLAMLMK